MGFEMRLLEEPSVAAKAIITSTAIGSTTTANTFAVRGTAAAIKGIVTAVAAYSFTA
jgi:hypothetical protein